MIREVVEEAREIVGEMPGFAAAFLLLTMLCIGARCAVFYEADGEELKLVADDRVGDATTDASDVIGRMLARTGCSMKTPGFTVIVGLRQYGVELSIPAASVRSLFENARLNVRNTFAFEAKGTA
jgi:hypothetical protein